MMNPEIEKARKKRGLTRKHLAKLVGVNPQYIYQIERIEGRGPSLKLWKRIKKVLPGLKI